MITKKIKSISISEEKWKELGIIAGVNNISKSNTIEMLIQDYFEKYPALKCMGISNLMKQCVEKKEEKQYENKL